MTLAAMWDVYMFAIIIVSQLTLTTRVSLTRSIYCQVHQDVSCSCSSFIVAYSTCKLILSKVSPRKGWKVNTMDNIVHVRYTVVVVLPIHCSSHQLRVPTLFKCMPTLTETRTT